MNKTVIIVVSFLFLLNINLFAQKKANLEGVEIGKKVPEVILPNVDGDNFKLSQLQGKVVLLNYWASWCAPCRKKAPELIEIHTKYKTADFKDYGNGFEIVSISLDRNEDAWKNAISKDGIGVMVNVGDMNGWKCKAAVDYNIKRIPTTVLLDGEGKVIAFNLDLKDLKKKLKRMK